MTALESLIAGKDETIARLQGQIHELTERIKEMKRTHKMELQEANVRLQQEIYLAKHFSESDSAGKRTRVTRSSSRGRVKPKVKET